MGGPLLRGGNQSVLSGGLLSVVEVGLSEVAPTPDLLGLTEVSFT